MRGGDAALGAGGIGRSCWRQAAEFWERLWSLYVQSEVGWRLVKPNATAATANAAKTSKSLWSGSINLMPSSVRWNR